MKVQRTKTIEAAERLIVAQGMVNPRMSEAEVGRWQRNAPGGEVGRVSDKIADLSGMYEGAAKEAVKEFLANPDAEFRDVLGGAAAHDGGPDEGGTE
jgi:hypothetical protein